MGFAAMVVSAGMSYLQFVDLNSTRNLLILGVAFYFGLGVPTFFLDEENRIETGKETLGHTFRWFHRLNHVAFSGSQIADEAIHILLTTNFFVGGLAGFFLDVIIPGARKLQVGW